MAAEYEFTAVEAAPSKPNLTWVTVEGIVIVCCSLVPFPPRTVSATATVPDPLTTVAAMLGTSLPAKTPLKVTT